jgi:hypothetical protein
MDLCDLGAGKAFNVKEGEKNPSLLALVCIDLFSKTVYARGVANKSASTVEKAMKEILDSLSPSRVPKIIQSDGGGEFANKKMKQLLESKKIKHDIRGGYLKNQVVERTIRSFKKIAVLYIESHWTEFKKKWKENWIEIVPSIVSLMNRRINKSINLAPNRVEKNLVKAQEMQIAKKQFVPTAQYFNLLNKISKGEPVKDGAKHFKIGDKVLVQHEKRKFEKETIRNYLYKPWKITNILVARKPFLYALRDENNKKAKRLYYAKELMKAPSKPFVSQIPGGRVLETSTEGNEKRQLIEKTDLGKKWTSINIT